MHVTQFGRPSEKKVPRTRVTQLGRPSEKKVPRTRVTQLAVLVQQDGSVKGEIVPHEHAAVRLERREL